ncbi:hypothetical protein AMS69_13880 [Haloarcula rubripromontorii]|uniref:Uncharacterized protein n=1 Tax=Haloarcula rubripromontorii TaxID=1705562 RepID=A0A0N1IUI3_9EURY|nr:hypothetical protein [Haloarcula rubripromontorii]KOX92440.1 hypothetical protein AMS69_13880 [Haloarcula rubripromontorii]
MSINRQEVVKTLGIAAASAGFSGIGSATQNSSVQVNSIYGSEESPLSEGDIIDTQQQTKANSEASSSITVKPDDSYGRIVGFVYGIDESGRATFYVAKEPEEEAVEPQDQSESAVSKAKKFESELKKANRLFTETSVVSPSGIDPEWNHVTNGYTPYDRRPYGKLVESVDVYELDEDTTTNRFAMRQNANIYPGQAEWDNGYHWWYAEPEHKWDQGVLDYNPVDRAPRDDKTGGVDKKSVAISAGGPEISWQFSQPDVARYDESNSQVAKWHWNAMTDPLSYGDNQHALFKTGSTAETRDNPSDGDTLLGWGTMAKFTSRDRVDADVDEFGAGGRLEYDD